MQILVISLLQHKINNSSNVQKFHSDDTNLKSLRKKGLHTFWVRDMIRINNKKTLKHARKLDREKEQFQYDQYIPDSQFCGATNHAQTYLACTLCMNS